MKANHYKKFISAWLEKFKFMLFPPFCPGCRKEVQKTHLICAQCWSNLHFIPQPYETHQNEPLTPHPTFNLPLLYQENKTDWPFESACSVVLHKGLGKKLIVQYKYNDKLYLTPLLGGLMEKIGKKFIQDCDLIIPVPLHFWRYFSRNYNQAEELARFIAKRNNKIYLPNAVKRTRHTKQQALLNAEARKHNVKNAFHIQSQYKTQFYQKKILLIDDVYTTGATVKAVAETLQTLKPQQIRVLTFSCAYEEASGQKKFLD